VDSPKLYNPVYKQFILEIEKGFLLLDETSRASVVRFIKSQQHKNGAFIDRGGNPDLYYSLFGVWLSKALKLDSEQKNITKYVQTVSHVEKKVADKFALLLIQLALEKKGVKRKSVLQLFQRIFKGGKNLNTAYRFFLFMLSFDALYGQNRFVYFLVRQFLNFYRTPTDLPCSFFSALLLAKFLTGKKVEKEAKILFGYFEKEKGFKVFKEQENADLLSTSVALFALKKAGVDLRLVTPDCLNLVQQNYDGGAFLSGDGDSSRDLEYTFYGLLILGVLS
jgi:hypothetical protein